VAVVLDAFIPVPDIRERHTLPVHAPADVAADVARHFDMASLPLVRSAFWLRGKLMGARGPDAQRPMDVASLLRMGWGLLAEAPGRFFAAGAKCQTWRGNVVFTPVEASQFASYSEPGFVKIAWTFETEPLGPTLTSLASETRAVGTDAAARIEFLRYWRWARFGIVGIRRLLLPAIRRSAQQRWSAGR